MRKSPDKLFIMKKRAVLTFLFLLRGACCTLADNSTCAAPSESDFNDTSNDCRKSKVFSGPGRVLVLYTVFLYDRGTV